MVDASLPPTFGLSFHRGSLSRSVVDSLPASRIFRVDRPVKASRSVAQLVGAIANSQANGRIHTRSGLGSHPADALHPTMMRSSTARLRERATIRPGPTASTSLPATAQSRAAARITPGSVARGSWRRRASRSMWSDSSSRDSQISATGGAQCSSPRPQAGAFPPCVSENSSHCRVSNIFGGLTILYGRGTGPSGVPPLNRWMLFRSFAHSSKRR